MQTCGRCGGKSETLYTFRPGGNARREKLCDCCRAVVKANRKPSGGTFVKAGGTLRGNLSPEEIAEDNARWDRVFQKFVDPAYYAPVIPTLQSSFGAFASQIEVAYRG